MGSLTFLALFSAALSGADPDNNAESYAEAHQVTVRTGRPMLIMVSTDWCVPCQRMKKSIIPQLRQRGLFKRVAFAVVNPDQDRELADQLTGGGPVPQLVMYRKTRGGWTRQKLIGGQSVEAVEAFIQQGIAADEPAQDAGKTPPAEAAKKGVAHEVKRPTA